MGVFYSCASNTGMVELVQHYHEKRECSGFKLLPYYSML